MTRVAVTRIAVALAALILPWSAALAQPQAPPRDTAAAPAADGAGIIRGRVTALDSGRPLRRARITIENVELGMMSRQATSTGLDGRFEFTRLRPARYKVSVTRSGYLPLEYGQRRPGEQGRPVQLADKQTLEDVDFSLPRMSVISGRVVDEFGEPTEGIAVYAMRALFFDGRRRFVPVNLNTTTDDAGEYRIQRLPPGTYAVMAATRETWVVNENGVQTTHGYLPTYFPGVGNAGDAQTVTVGVGQVRGAIDLALVPGRAPAISGSAVDSSGRPFARVSLRDEVRGVDFASFRGGPDATVNADGSFRIPNVPPGEYVLTASRTAAEGTGEPEVAQLPIAVGTVDIENIALVGSRGGTVRGRVTVEGASTPKMSSVRIAVLEPTRGQPSPTLLGTFRSPTGFATTTVAEDGSFTVDHVFGRARFQVTVPDGWMVKSIEHQGRDVSDTALELRSSEELTGVDVVLTSQVSRIAGQLTDAKGLPLRDATVIVFPADRERWFEGSRRLRAVRPDQRGQWEVTALPPGDYLVLALDYVDGAGWVDPEYLEALRDYGQAITIREGTVQSIALKLTQPNR